MAPSQAAAAAGAEQGPAAGQATPLILALPKGRILREVVPLSTLSWGSELQSARPWKANGAASGSPASRP